MTTRSERRALRMHPRLLWDVITKQAGTLQKAILEGIMNSIDAGATICRVNLSNKGFTIEDDGKGFQSEEEIANFFETFGYPHEQGDAVYGRFRMGRGQMFAFGVNKWSSNQFRMTVDLKPQEKDIRRDSGALSYDFSSGHKVVPGCRIEVSLYRTLLPSELEATRREIQSWVKWVKIPVELDGKIISRDPATANWTSETDDAWILVQDRVTLDIYNLGVLVCRQPSHILGCGGVVVSKKQLDVNFARNDIQSTCPVWKRISGKLRAESLTTISRKPKLTDFEREALTDRLIAGEITGKQARDLRIITNVLGSNTSLSGFNTIVRTHGGTITIGKIGDRVVETAHQRGIAYGISQATLDRFHCETADEFLLKLRQAFANDHIAKYLLEPIRAMTREELLLLVPEDYDQVPEKDLTARERGGLFALQRAADAVIRLLDPYQERRKISIGSSASADGWTDGKRKIWINRKALDRLNWGMSGAVMLVGLLVHEYLHDSSDMGSHVHDEEFYRRHHDTMLGRPKIGAICENLLRDYLGYIRRQTQRAPLRRLLASEDLMASRNVLAEDHLTAEDLIARVKGRAGRIGAELGNDLQALLRSQAAQEEQARPNDLEPAILSIRKAIDSIAGLERVKGRIRKSAAGTGKNQKGKKS